MCWAQTVIFYSTTGAKYPFFWGIANLNSKCSNAFHYHGRFCTFLDSRSMYLVFKKNPNEKYFFSVEKLLSKKIFEKKSDIFWKNPTFFEKIQISIEKSFKIDFPKIDFKWLFNWNVDFFQKCSKISPFFVSKTFFEQKFLHGERIFFVLFFFLTLGIYLYYPKKYKTDHNNKHRWSNLSSNLRCPKKMDI